MKQTTTTDLRMALATFHERATALQLLIDERKTPERRRSWGWLPQLPATMLSIVALAVSLYLAMVPALPSLRLEAATPPKSLASSRVFALFPDGRVELSDQWSGRRQFQWDGRQWRSVDGSSIQAVVTERAPRPDKAVAAERSVGASGLGDAHLNGSAGTR